MCLSDFKMPCDVYVMCIRSNINHLLAVTSGNIKMSIRNFNVMKCITHVNVAYFIILPNLLKISVEGIMHVQNSKPWKSTFIDRPSIDLK